MRLLHSFLSAALLVSASSVALAQLQPLDDDATEAVLLAGLVEPLIAADRSTAYEYLRQHAGDEAESGALATGLGEVLDALATEPDPSLAGLYRHAPTGDVVAMLESESGLRLFVAIQRTKDGRIARVHLPAGGWQQPPPPPVVEEPISGLLDLPDTPPVVAFVNVAVVPMDAERVVREQTVIVRDGRIAEIGPSVSVEPPADALVLEASGHYLMPGLSEMHAHIPPLPMHGQVPAHQEGPVARTLFLFVANGVTTIRGMLGHPGHLDLRAGAEAHEILIPRIYTSGPSINGNSAPTPEVGRELVSDQHASGYDLLKIHPGLSRETYDAVVDAATRAGMQWAGHVPADVGLYRALDAGQITIDHLDSYLEALAGRGEGYSQQESGWFGLGLIDDVDPGRIPELARRTREAGVWNVPTQSLMEHLLSPDDAEEMIRWPEMRYMPAQTLRQWATYKPNLLAQLDSPEAAARYLQVRRDLIGQLQREGAGLLLGADAPQLFNVPGFSVHRELQFMVDSGLTPYEALVTGTRNPAAYLGTEGWGTVAEGAVADLVLLTANPLEDIANASAISGVMVRGSWLPGEEIERRLALIEEALAE